MDHQTLSDQLEEVSVGYAAANGITRDANWFMLKLQEEVGELTQAFLMKMGQARDKGLTESQIDESFRAEIADVFAQVILLARHHDIDLLAGVEEKWLRWHPSRKAPAEN
ncbi:pyrophosphatase [Arthrobacter liuii]|uniref:Pyrophosphatase n=1 Tax=Arthrobacter liuii TaxID=1476996 RepID=A0ABQ2B2C9_9MICC|nr:pyrophosphatase [Arthrobacter liuii]GGI02518.1 pyrophosphatase [Arthrobacter liuii]